MAGSGRVLGATGSSLFDFYSNCNRKPPDDFPQDKDIKFQFSELYCLPACDE